MLALRYPSGPKRSAIVTSANRSSVAVRGVTIGPSGAEGRPGIQSVTPVRTGYFPVNMLARVGEQTGQAAYALVNRAPSAAAVQIRRREIRVAVTGQVAPTEIVGQDENEVGFASAPHVRQARRHPAKNVRLRISTSVYCVWPRKYFSIACRFALPRTIIP